MWTTQIVICAFCIISGEAGLLDFGVVSTSPEPSPQYSEMSGLKNELGVIQKQLDKILQTRSYYPRNCQDVQERGHNVSDLYVIKPEFSPEAFAVVCDMERRGGGWTYLLNRFDGSQNFFLNWNDYKNGFGLLLGEFWLGLDNIHYLTAYEINELLVELVDFNNEEVYAHYDYFGVGDEKEGYPLKLLGGYSGTAGDSLANSATMKFSTRGTDLDNSPNNCALSYGGAWWYNNCMDSLLTGEYGDETEKVRMSWYHFRGWRGLKQARMMVRPRRNTNPNLLPHDKH